MRPWPLELDAEVAASATGITPRLAGRPAVLLAGTPGIDQVSVERHCGEDAGLSPLVLVAARSPR